MGIHFNADCGCPRPSAVHFEDFSRIHQTIALIFLGQIEHDKKPQR